jgi:hypothetical protein
VDFEIDFNPQAMVIQLFGIHATLCLRDAPWRAGVTEGSTKPGP